MQVLSDPEKIESALIRDLFAYWQGKRRGGALPCRSDIEPADLRALLPNLLIVDFEQEPFRVKFRLVGTRIVELTGFEFTGLYLDEVAPPDVAAAFTACYRTASHRRQPVLERITWRSDQVISDYDICVLPLDDDGGAAQRAIAAECYARLEKQYDLTKLRRRPDRPAEQLL